MNPKFNSSITVDHGDIAKTLNNLSGIQVTESRNHNGWPARKRGSWMGDFGGDFHSVRKYALTPDMAMRMQPITGARVVDFHTNDVATYRGPVLAATYPTVQFPPTHESSRSDLEVLGAIAIARCAPTNPTSDVSTFLGELLQEGLPKLTGSSIGRWRTMSPRDRRKAIGDEYLNQEFGWAPFANDLGSIAASIVDAESILAQFERDSGKMVRRRYEFPLQQDTQVQLIDSQAGPWINPDTDTLYKRPAVYGQLFRTSQVTKRQWFSGAFTYYVPMGSDLRSTMARRAIEAKKVLGLSLTPDSVWNLTPWSWAVDWFTNAGDVLANYSAWALDNQVLLYGYMMEHTVSSYRYTLTGNSPLQGNPVPQDVTTVSETKVRYKATPYGFGITWNGLSTFQKAILVALGLTHS